MDSRGVSGAGERTAPIKRGGDGGWGVRVKLVLEVFYLLPVVVWVVCV